MFCDELNHVAFIIEQTVWLKCKTCSDTPSHRDVSFWVIGL